MCKVVPTSDLYNRRITKVYLLVYEGTKSLLEISIFRATRKFIYGTNRSIKSKLN